MNSVSQSAPAFEKISLGNEVHYVLPVRKYGGVGLIAIFAIFLGVAFVGLCIYAILDSGDLLAPFFAFSGLAFCRRGLLKLIPTTCTIRVTPTHLIAQEKANLIRATTRVNCRRVSSLTVHVPSAELIARVGIMAEASFGITVNLTNGKQKILLAGYSQNLLEPLATDLAMTLNKMANPLAPDGAPPANQVQVRIEYVKSESS